MDPKFKKIVEFARENGLESFLLVVKRGSLQTFHFEKLAIKDAMTMMIAGFHKVIDMELETHPEYEKSYKQIYLDLAGEFNEMIKKVNERFDNYGKKKK